MKRTLLPGLSFLLWGLVTLTRGKGETPTLWWTAALVGNQAREAEFALLGVPTGPVGAIAVALQDPLTLYLGGAEGLFHSSDGGETWALLSQELRYPHTLLVDPDNPPCLYAARRDLASFLALPGVYRSNDGGATWQERSAGLGEERIFALAPDPHRAGALYAGSWAGRVYKTVDGAEHWTLASPEPVQPRPQRAAGTIGQLLVSPLDGALYALEAYTGTFRSTDGGATWVQISDDGGWLAIDPLRGDLYLAGRRLQRSTDGGATWKNLSRGLPYDPRTGAYTTAWIGVNPQPLTLYTRFHRSTDGGATWQRLEAPTSFVPRLLQPGERPVIYGSVNGRAGRYLEASRGSP